MKSFASTLSIFNSEADMDVALNWSHFTTGARNSLAVDRSSEKSLRVMRGLEVVNDALIFRVTP